MSLTAFVVPNTCSADVLHLPNIKLLISPVCSLNERLQNRGKNIFHNDLKKLIDTNGIIKIVGGGKHLLIHSSKTAYIFKYLDIIDLFSSLAHISTDKLSTRFATP